MKKKTSRFEKDVGISKKKFDNLYKNYSKKYNIYEETGFTRSDKLTRSQFKQLLKDNKKYLEDEKRKDEIAGSAKKIFKSKIREQSTLIYDGEQISGKTARRWYESYVRRYTEAKAKLGDKMYDQNVMTFNEYMANRKTYKDMGITQNINRQLVTDQSYEYTMTNAMKLKEIAGEYGFDEIAEANVRDIMKGDIDLSQAQGNRSFLTELNEALKNAHPDWTGSYRASFISHAVYGS